MNQKSLCSLIFIILCFFKSAHAEDSPLLIENAWIAEAPPVSKVMVAYMTIKNMGTKTIEIISAKSEIYSSIEFHETVHKDGIASMLRHKSLRILPNKSIELKRGGQHFMLFNPTKALKAGDMVNIRISTTDDICQTILVPVKKSQY